ncbi:hypothetical protein R3P38DRAFT_3597643 [Favolaschia claudopus]|uniref:Uncharacterized protein n=1 Tax=Favolaschia claudopus TaxID=2862362 RepID=A0AAW0ADJ3_9AGAR
MTVGKEWTTLTLEPTISFPFPFTLPFALALNGQQPSSRRLKSQKHFDFAQERASVSMNILNLKLSVKTDDDSASISAYNHPTTLPPALPPDAPLSLIFGIPGVDAHPHHPPSLSKAKRTPAFQRLLFPSETVKPILTRPTRFKPLARLPASISIQSTHGEAFFPRRSDYQPCERSTRIKPAAAPLERRMIKCVVSQSLPSSTARRSFTYLPRRLSPRTFKLLQAHPHLLNPDPSPIRPPHVSALIKNFRTRATAGKPKPSQIDQALATY